MTGEARLRVRLARDAKVRSRLPQIEELAREEAVLWGECKTCRTPFGADEFSRKAYCSKRCKDLSNDKERLAETCGVCNRPFVPRAPNGKYCGLSCADFANRVKNRERMRRYYAKVAA